MANFSQDQVRQLYVVKSKATTFDATTPSGAILIKGTPEDVFFNYQTPNGDNGNATTVRSDLIPLKNIEYAVATKPASRPLKKVEVTLDSTLNGGDPIVGQEYILRFTFYNLGLGGPENQYIKNGGAYRVKTGDTAETVLKALKSLAETNFSREAYPMVTFTISGTGATTKLVIEEVPQPWVRGKRQASQINFAVNTVPVSIDGGYYPWGTVTDVTSTNTNVVKNGRIAADMEWFYIGERADQFRGMNYPNNFETIYLADPAQEYHFIDIHYFYAGDAEDIQKSKKYITLAIPSDSTYAIADIITDLTTAGVTVVDKTV